MGIYIGSLYVPKLISLTEDTEIKEVNSGLVHQVLTDEMILRLPWTGCGLTYTIVNGAYDNTIGFKILPKGTDRIMGGGLEVIDGQPLELTKTVSKKGDLITLVGDGDRGWTISFIIGDWRVVSY